ncbi:MAG: Crp/Fnr family transcriptional regulator [Desulfosalsimonadaceae bacterium]
MKKYMPLLNQSVLFGGLPEEHLEAILSIAAEKQTASGEMIFFEGDPADGFCMVADGMVKIYKLSPGGKEQILHMFGPGEPFGEVPVFSGGVFPANAEAVKNSTILFFPRKRFVDLIIEKPHVALNMLAILSKRLRHFTVQVENLSLKEVPARLAGYFLLLSEEQKSTRTVTLNISKGQLAGFLGTIPETLSRMLRKMSDQGLIEVEGRKIRLKDVDGLIDLSETGRLESAEI